MDLNKITHHLDVVKKCIKIIEDEMQNNPGIVVKVNNASPNVNLKVNGQQVLKSEHPSQPPTPFIQTLEAAKKIVNDQEWPEAVPSDLLADETPEDMSARATGILEAQIDRNLSGLSFLDFGCGEGYTIPAVLEKGVSRAVGYDLKKSPTWDVLRKEMEENSGLSSDPFAAHNIDNTFHFSDNYDLMAEQWGPFDVVLLYDVLDHTENPQEVLQQVGKVLSPNGIVYVRCHPWTSRHGGHLYRKLNKAYVHLAVDETNLKALGYKPETVKKVLRPLKHYKEIIQASGFKVVRDYVKNDPIENFFRNNDSVKRLLHRHWDGERTKTPPLDEAKINHILEIEFFDALLMANTLH